MKILSLCERNAAIDRWEVTATPRKSARFDIGVDRHDVVLSSDLEAVA